MKHAVFDNIEFIGRKMVDWTASASRQSKSVYFVLFSNNCSRKLIENEICVKVIIDFRCVKHCCGKIHWQSSAESSSSVVLVEKSICFWKRNMHPNKVQKQLLLSGWNCCLPFRSTKKEDEPHAVIKRNISKHKHKHETIKTQWRNCHWMEQNWHLMFLLFWREEKQLQWFIALCFDDLKIVWHRRCSFTTSENHYIQIITTRLLLVECGENTKYQLISAYFRLITHFYWNCWCQSAKMKAHNCENQQPNKAADSVKQKQSLFNRQSLSLTVSPKLCKLMSFTCWNWHFVSATKGGPNVWASNILSLKKKLCFFFSHSLRLTSSKLCQLATIKVYCTSINDWQSV